MSLFLIPIVIWYSVFVAFEPYNYFQLSKTDRNYTEHVPLGRMRKTMNREYDCLLLGDSRTASIDEDLLYKITGDRYNNLAFGGASLQESIDLFWWAIDYQDFSKVIMQISFYSVCTGYNSNRIKKLERTAENPILFLTNEEYHGEAFKQIISIINNENANQSKKYTVEERKNNKITYANEIILPVVKNYEINYELLEEVKRIADYCKQNNIDFYLFIPPVDETIWQYVIEPLALYDELDEYKTALSYYATIYDLEFENNANYVEEDFVDGFHLYGLGQASYNTLEEYPALKNYLYRLLNIETTDIFIWENGTKTRKGTI